MKIKEVVVVVHRLVLFFFAFGLALSASESQTIPHAADGSFSVGYIQMRNAKNCSYSVTIDTSCSSPKVTTDQISIVFGDAHGNQVFAPRLDGNHPISKTFGQCASDRFHREGPCTHKICFAYLRRLGPNFKGWKPQTVQIYSHNLDQQVAFNFNTFIPNNTWYGYNFCESPPPPPSLPPPLPSPAPHPHPPHEDSPPPPHHDEPPPPHHDEPSPPPPHHHSPPPPSPPPPHYHSPPPPSPPPPSHPPPPPPSPPPPSPSPPPPPPSPSPPPPPPPSPPPSSSNHLSNQNWIIYLVVGLVLSIIWM
ncbi:hypothetical protein PIB30_116958 [Stylosanthes scabra]|uniref:Uncharacterized protein n=1 Tax=Stylosanthes scabra TaxID=79078 RepID=A0ABU6Z3L6_9FABA|nr:hypothetical protein [Stylosanthes scabra]